MYAVLVAFSVPAPLVAGWLSDRLGRKPLIVGVYVGGAIAFGVVILAGSNIAALWFGILLLGVFNFAESPQLQALLADIAPPAIRDASYSAYFTLAFGVGSLWVALYSVVIDALGPDDRAAGRLRPDGGRLPAGRLRRAAHPRRPPGGRERSLRDRPAGRRHSVKTRSPRAAAVGAAAAAALLDDRLTAARLIGASIPATWPQDDLLDVLPMQAAASPRTSDSGSG